MKQKTNAEAIKEIIKSAGRFLYRKEVIDLAAKSGAPFNTDLKSTFSSLVKKKELVLFMPAGNVGVYGLPEYVNFLGNVVKRREYIANPAYERPKTEGDTYRPGRTKTKSRRKPELSGLKVIEG